MTPSEAQVEKMRALEGVTVIYAELPKLLFIAQLKTLEIHDWGLRVTVAPLVAAGLSSPTQEFAVACVWGVLSLTDTRWQARNVGWSIFFGKELVARLTTRAAEIDNLNLQECIPDLYRAVLAVERQLATKMGN